MDGFMDISQGCSVLSRLMHPVHNHEKDGRRPAAHQDAGERLDPTDQAPLLRQDQVAVAGRGVSDGAEIQGRDKVGKGVSPRVEKRPYRNLDQMQENDPSGRPDEQPDREPVPLRSLVRPRRFSQRNKDSHSHGMHDHAQRRQRPGDEKSRDHSKRLKV